MRVSVRSMLCLAVGFVATLAFATTGLGQSESAAKGECGSMYGEKVCTTYRMKSGKVTEFTLRVPIALIQKVPANLPMVWPPKADVVVPFAPAVEKQTGFRFANIYWESGGHPPAVYMVPHFDFHFYFAPQEEVQSIDCKDLSKPADIPSGYSLPDINVPQLGELVGVCVPAMGMHAVPDSDLKPKAKWKGSMLVGYYHTKPLFIEPMITRELLLRKQSFSYPIPQIEPAPQVRYPRQFRAIYESSSESFDFVFSY